jgi:hypothetical protein
VIDPPRTDDSGLGIPAGQGPGATSQEIRDWFKQHWPQATEKPAVALELGCAEILQKSALEESGFEYLGVDYDSTHAQMLLDAHSLPFRDNSFPFVVAFAFLEHL